MFELFFNLLLQNLWFSLHHGVVLLPRPSFLTVSRFQLKSNAGSGRCCTVQLAMLVYYSSLTQRKARVSFTLEPPMQQRWWPHGGSEQNCLAQQYVYLQSAQDMSRSQKVSFFNGNNQLYFQESKDHQHFGEKSRLHAYFAFFGRLRKSAKIVQPLIFFYQN